MSKKSNTPTHNQAKRIARSLNQTRINRGNSNCPKFWAIVESGELIVGCGDTPQSKPRAVTWDEAQEIVEGAEAGRITA